MTRCLRPAASIDRRTGASYVSPLSTREFLQLSEIAVQRWPFGGWALLNPTGSVAGYHWRDLFTTSWSTPDTAFAGFVPHIGQREQLTDSGWTVEQDPDGALLAPYLRSMSAGGLVSLDQLHYVLLHVLAECQDALTTADLRRAAHEVIDGRAVPLVNEAVYRALRTLLRLGQVSHHSTGGRHVYWSLTPSGALTVERLDGENH